MGKTKLTLPRHTNLAKQSSRFAAFIIDLACVGALFLGLFAGVHAVMRVSIINELTEKKEAQELESHLKYLDENEKLTILGSEDSWEKYRDTLSYYYLTYLPTISENKDDLVEGVSRAEYYSVDWFNKNVFKITENPDAEHSVSLFTYEKDGGGNYDLTKLGIPRIGGFYYDSTNNQELEITESTINVFLQERLQEAFLNFQEQDYVLAVINPLYFYTTLSVVVSSLLTIIAVYIVVPLILKNGQTLGKKVTRIGLANSDGYKFNNKQLLMRAMPISVLILSLLLPFYNNLLLMAIVFLTIFLVSFALAMASPKKSSLHDFVARTIVIDEATSIIFENEVEEESYLLKEDNIPVEASYGEEPELRYEK